MDLFSVFRQSILAGIAIGLGCTAYISCENPVVGALLFTIGLVSIVSFRWKLFTGMLCFKNKLGNLAVCYLGNLFGVVIIFALSLLKSEKLARIAEIGEKKLQNSWYSTFCSAILCEFCIFIAVFGYKKVQYVLGRYLLVVLGVVVFVVSGFEHSIADMYYILGNLAINGMKSEIIFENLAFLVVVTAGNVVGSLIIRKISGE